jgi:hypothetical protein
MDVADLRGEFLVPAFGLGEFLLGQVAFADQKFLGEVQLGLAVIGVGPTGVGQGVAAGGPPRQPEDVRQTVFNGGGGQHQPVPGVHLAHAQSNLGMFAFHADAFIHSDTSKGVLTQVSQRRGKDAPGSAGPLGGIAFLTDAANHGGVGVFQEFILDELPTARGQSGPTGASAMMVVAKGLIGQIVDAVLLGLTGAFGGPPSGMEFGFRGVGAKAGGVLGQPFVIQGMNFAAVEKPFADIGFGKPVPHHHFVRGGVVERGRILNAIAAQLGVAGEIIAGGQLATAIGGVDGGEVQEGVLTVQYGALGPKFFPGLGHDLLVQVAGNDEQHWGQRLQRFTADFGQRLETDLKGGPDEQCQAFAAAGVVRQDNAVGHGGAGIVFALETFKSKPGTFRKHKRERPPMGRPLYNYIVLLYQLALGRLG